MEEVEQKKEEEKNVLMLETLNALHHPMSKRKGKQWDERKLAI